jgi:intein/homing endonuclease
MEENNRYKKQHEEQNVKNLSQVWTTEKVNELLENIDAGVDVKSTPFWDGKPEWRSANIVYEYTVEEMEEIQRCARDVIYFANNYCFSMTDEGVKNIKLRDYQEDVLRDFQDSRFCVFLSPRQVGKAQPLDAIVWKSTGKARFGDLLLGDKIYDASGNLTSVVGIFPQGKRDVYNITFSDGSTVRSCGEHLWTVETVDGTEKTLELREIVSKGLLSKRGDYKWFVRTSEPVNFPEADFNIDPYFLGLMLGDGCMSNKYLNVASADSQIVEYLNNEVCEAHDVCIKQNGHDRYAYFVTKKSGYTNEVITELKSLGLMGKRSEHKFIPEIYLYGSIQQRLSLLQGLMDTNGHVTKKSNVVFTTSSPRLADDVQQLCESLGIVVCRSVKETGYRKEDGTRVACLPAHRLKLMLPNGFAYPIFRLDRKQRLIRDKHYDWGRRRGIASVELDGHEDVQCIMVDNQDHLYLTDHFIPTHNTITTGIFLTWYLLFHSDKNLMVLSNTGATTIEIIDKIKVILQNLPFFLKPGIILNNQMTMKFDNGCRLFGRNTTKTAAIGFAIHFLYCDEFAHIHQNFIDPFWRSVYPTLSSSNISRVVITSTPNGMNKFYDIYTAALEGKNEFKPIRIDWWQVPGRDEAWMRREIGNLGSEEDFNQEYGCFTGDSLVTTIDGVKPIRDIHPGDLVLTHSNRYHKVKVVSERVYDGELHELYSYGNNRPIKCTNEHPIRTVLEGRRYEWTSADSIRTEDWLCYAKPLLKKSKVISEDMALLIGWYIAKGCARKSQVSFGLHKEETGFRDQILRCLATVSSGKVHVRVRDNSTEIIVNDADLVEFFVKNCGAGALEKKIPFELIAGHEQIVYDTLINGDGFYKNKTHDGYTTVSYTLAYQLQLLSHALGYTCSITFGNKSGIRKVVGRDVFANEAHQLRINKATSNNDNKKSRIRCHKLSVSGQVKAAKKYPYFGTVYNLEVEVDNSYFVEGRAVHNCQFLASSKLLLDHKTLGQVKRLTTEFVWHEITDLHNKEINYEHLKWHPKFNLDTIKDTDRFVFTIDTAGGGGGDYTILNIFKLVPMPEKMIEQQLTANDEGDFMSLLQVGMFRSNKAGVEDLQPIVETLLYDVFGEDAVKIVLEMDFKGNLLYERMSNHTKFYEDMFIHTKHSENAKRMLPGIKLNPKNKYEYCMEFRRLVRSGRIIPCEKNTFNELMSFGLDKKGSYSSQIGHDDIAMSMVNLVPFFSSDQYYEIVENIYDGLDEKYRTLITNKLTSTRDEPQKSYDSDFLSGLMS